jgi:hypothetical protein
VITLGDPNNFARKFVAGDYLRLNITGHAGEGGTGEAKGTISFDLANYRDGLSFALGTWATVDLSSLAGLGVRSLRFGLESTDVGIFGINTPTYFAIDNVRVTAVPEPGALMLLVVGLGLIAAPGPRRARAPRA